MADKILNREQLLDSLHEFNRIFKQVNKDVGPSSGVSAEVQYNVVEYFLNQFDGWLDLDNVRALVKERKQN